MKNLIEVSKIVTKKRVSKIEIFDKSLLNKKDSKFNEFYEGLVSEKFSTDEEAADFLYGTTPLDDKYRQLKSRFSKRLLNTLFFLDANDPAFSGYHRAHYTCNKNWALVRILLGNGARHSAIKMTRKILKVAQDYRFSDVIFNCARIMMGHMSMLGKEREYEQYVEMATAAQQSMSAELRAEELYQRLTIKFAGSASVKLDLTETAQAYVEEVKALCQKHDAYILHWYMYQIWILSRQIQNDHSGTVQVCEAAEVYLGENPPFDQQKHRAHLALIKLNCHLQLRDYEQGRENAERCLKLFEEGKNAWFVFLEYYFLLAMHTENYINAAGIYLKVINHPRFEYTNAMRQEKWKIFEAYLNYIFETEGLDRSLLQNSKKRKFRLLKFLNEVPTYTKDKKGFNVAILIIQILYLLEKGEYDAIINRSEALNVYCSRYLRKDDSFRSSAFIKMLLVMDKEDFKYDRTKQMAAKFLRKMQEHAEAEGNEVQDWEIIPYETLWQKVLNRLKAGAPAGTIEPSNLSRFA
jgi:hypothetical protein